jgi:cell division septation protein DedD
VNSLVEAPVAVDKPAPPVAKAVIAPFKAVKAVAKSRPAQGGRYVVQIGAYRNALQVEQAWGRALKRYGFANNEPLSTTVSIPGRGTFHRLAVAGFQYPAQASNLCQTIRAKGGTCFVRATAGDAPVQWASRYTRRA